MMPIFLYCSMGYCLDMLMQNEQMSLRSLREMSKCPVGVCHAVRFFFLPEGRSFFLGRKQNFFCELLRHWLSLLGAGCYKKPAQCQTKLPIALYLYRHLVGGSSDAARPHFHERRNVFHCLLEYFQRFFLALLFNQGKGSVYDLSRNGFLSPFHDMIDEFGNNHILVYGVGMNESRGCFSPSHSLSVSENYMVLSEANGSYTMFSALLRI